MERVTTGPEGIALFGLPADEELVLQVAGNETSVGEWTQRIAPLARGEHRELTIELQVGPDIHYFGQLIANETGALLAGVRVFVPYTQSPAEAVTDSRGLFEIEHFSWERRHLQIDAPGFGRTLVVFTSGHEDEAHAQVIRLSQSSSLAASLSEAGRPLEGITLHATTNFGNLIRPRGLGNTTGRDPVWQADSDAAGRLEIDGLPPGVPLQIELRRKAELLRKLPDALQLLPGERREVAYALGEGGVLRGIAVLEEGSPVQGVHVWLRRSEGDRARYFNFWDAEKLAKKTVTDRHGRFTFEDVALGAWLCGPAWSGGREVLQGPHRIAPIAQYFVLEQLGQVVDLRLEVSRGLYIRGSVIDAHGKAYGNDWVRLKTSHQAGVQDFRSDPGGHFVAGPLAPGEYQVRASGQGLNMNSEPVTASAGSDDLVLRLKPAGMIRGRIVDGVTGEGCQAELRLISLESPLGYVSLIHSQPNTGEFVHDSLESGTYHLLARTDDGRIALARDIAVVAGVAREELTVRLQQGAILVVLPGDDQDSSFSLVNDGLGVGHGFIGVGKSATQTLFPGRTQVRYRAGAGGQLDVDVVAGATLELVLPPQ